MTKPTAPETTGRPSFYSELMKTKTIRLTQAQREKLARLGGGQWVRDQIDAAEEQPKQE